MVNIAPILPALLPLATLLWIRSSDYSVPISRNNWLQEYDYIIVGGGSAGAVLANRLSEVTNWNILLLEAGGSESFLSDIPIAAATLQMTPIDWAYQTEPQEASCFGLINRRSRWPRGRVLGGSSVLNYMLYIRGNARDYDRWNRIGAQGWSWADVFPYFLKSEDNRDASIAFNGYHGTGGYLTVATPPDVTPIGTAFTEAGKYLGYPNIDLNGPLQAGFAIPQGTIRRGARCSTSKAFLRPARSRPNLHVLTFAYATRILFTTSKRAVGVQFDRFSLSYTVFARREVILSAGSINTAQLLMLSGVGPSDHLRSLGIPVVANLPVGNNLQDHIYPGVHFSLDAPVSLVQRRVVTVPNLLRYFATGRGPLTALGGVEGLAFIKTKYSNLTDDHPDFQIHLLSGSPTSDDGQTFRRVQGITRELWQQFYRPYVPTDTLSFYPVLLRPKSRGYIRLRSSSPYDPPILDPRYLTHPDDIITMVDAMKICIALGMTPAYKKLNARLFETIIPGCEIYPTWSDEYLACAARTYTSTIYHPVGTARMGQVNDPRSVVDPHLRVLGGISALRIADGSVMPEIISGNTNAPIIMIAERLADFLKGVRLPPLRPAVASQTTLGAPPVLIPRSDSNQINFAKKADFTHEPTSITNKQEMQFAQTDFKFVDNVMKKLRAEASARERLMGIYDASAHYPKHVSTDYLQSRSNSIRKVLPTNKSYQNLYKDIVKRILAKSGLTKSKRGLNEPLGLPVFKQKRTLQMLNKLESLVGQFGRKANITGSEFNKNNDFKQFNNYYETLMANQNYNEKELTDILDNLKILLKQQSNFNFTSAASIFQMQLHLTD